MQKHVEKVLQIVGENERFSKIRVDFSEGGSKGAGYLSIVNSAEIHGADAKLSVIVKTATSDPNVRKMLPIRESFLCEINFYEKVMPVFAEFQKGLECGFNSVPRCYFASAVEFEEVLVFENLMTEGYENWNRVEAMPARVAEMVLRQYAKFHAVSFALKDQRRQKYNELAEGLKDNMYCWLKYGKLVKASEKLCRKFKAALPSEDIDFHKRLETFCDGIQSFMYDYRHADDDFAVISHADCWCSNMMFKFKDVGGEKQLSSMRFIDYQVCRCSSLIFDISHFLCTCTDDTVWEQLDCYLHIYHESLCDHMRRLGTDPAKIIPFETFRIEFDEKCKYGLVMCAIFLKVTLIDVTEAPDMEDNNYTDFVDLFTADFKNQHIYDKRFGYLMRYFYKHNLL